MAERRIIFLLLWIFLQYSHGISRPDKLHLHKSLPYPKEEPSFFSQIASWIFPFGSSPSDIPDSLPSSTHHRPKYLPPPSSSGPKYSAPPPHQQTTGCNPCNQEPWVPIPGSSGATKVIEELHSPDTLLDGLNPPPPHYEPPQGKEYYGPPPTPAVHPQLPVLYGPPAPRFRPKNTIGAASIKHELTNHQLPSSLNYRDIIGMRAPPMQSPHNIQDILHPPVSQHSILEEEFPPYTRRPISGHSPNIEGIEQIPLSSGDNDEFHGPLVVPNLSIRPLAPIRNYGTFRQHNNQKVESIQILPGILVGDYLSSIEHPINVIQSPIVEVNVKNEPQLTNSEPVTPQPILYTTNPNPIQSGLFVNPSINRDKLDHNPIVVDDSHASASSYNESYNDIHSTKRENDVDIGSQDSSHARETPDDANTKIPLDYSQWKPTFGGLSMEISPPPPPPPIWVTPSSTQSPPTRPKHVQIVIPYYNFNGSMWNSGKSNEFIDPNYYTTLVPVYRPPPSTENSVWSHYLDDLAISSSNRHPATEFQPKTTTRVYNIQDILGPNKEINSDKPPFDVLSFQKNIDEWTQQSFAKTTAKLSSDPGVIRTFKPSKQIPEEYLTTVPYDYTTSRYQDGSWNEIEAAGSDKRENIGENLVIDDPTSTTEEVTTAPTPRAAKTLSETTTSGTSAGTNEKVYIVTPASTPILWSMPPKVQNGTTKVERALLFEHPKFTIRIEEGSPKAEAFTNSSSSTKVIFSEWPHKINNLQTTTIKPTSRHPLFGLMDVSAYNPPDGQMVETINGHSKVAQETTLRFGNQERTTSKYAK